MPIARKIPAISCVRAGPCCAAVSGKWPHERLGLFDELELENCEDAPIGVLLDGEPATLGSRATFSVAACEVDLLATAHGY